MMFQPFNIVSRHTKADTQYDVHMFKNAWGSYLQPEGTDLDEAVPDDHQVRDEMIGYLASVNDCRTCVFKGRCCPKWPFRKVTRSIYEPARDVARAIATTEFYQQTRRDRK